MKEFPRNTCTWVWLLACLAAYGSSSDLLIGAILNRCIIINSQLSYVSYIVPSFLQSKPMFLNFFKVWKSTNVFYVLAQEVTLQETFWGSVISLQKCYRNAYELLIVSWPWFALNYSCSRGPVFWIVQKLCRVVPLAAVFPMHLRETCRWLLRPSPLKSWQDLTCIYVCSLYKNVVYCKLRLLWSCYVLFVLSRIGFHHKKCVAVFWFFCRR